MVFCIAAAFFQIKNRLYNISNILRTSYNASTEKLTILFRGGEKDYLNGEEEIEEFYSTIDQFVLRPHSRKPELEAVTGPPSIDHSDDPPTDDPVKTDDDPESEANEDDDDPSELEAAGLPSDIAALLHAGGVNTVDEALTHPDLEVIEDIGKARKEKILAILDPTQTV